MRSTVVACGVDLDAHRVLEEALGERRDLGRHGGREQRRLPPRVQRRDDLPHRLDEAHVEHPVGLVEDDAAGLVEDDRAVVHQVGAAGPAWRRRRRRRAPSPAPGRCATCRRGRAASRAARRRRSCGRPPRSARRARGSARGRAPGRSSAPAGRASVEELVQDRQREGRGLAGAGLGDAEDVAARQLRGDRLRLDRRRGVEAGAGERGGERLGEAEVRESGMSSQVFLSRGGPCRSRSAALVRRM